MRMFPWEGGPAFFGRLQGSPVKRPHLAWEHERLKRTFFSALGEKPPKEVQALSLRVRAPSPVRLRKPRAWPEN